MHAQLKLTTRPITVTGSLDLTALPALRARLSALTPGTRVTLDLSAVTACDHRALGILLAAARRARNRGGALELLTPSAPVLDALTATGLIRLLPVVADRTTDSPEPEIATAA
ncbi:STAS domain-containing protein [Streptomyces sp. NBC_01465]|uniref:STAS domain-containing protein n=1 Tax=Streptomyces sp. NBC_01465 TaxID=2903878 RepID=UPI002E326420|nr:STAS domain-containing protein [Streptomyces sp. NBC_01465]